MHRQPATSHKRKPECYGHRPSILFEGCWSCACRDDCFAALSTPEVGVLPHASTFTDIAKAGDRRATDLLIHGLDSVLYRALRVVVVKHGLRMKIVHKPPYRVRVFDRDRQIVFMVMRLDRRRVVLDAKRVDHEAAYSLGGTRLSSTRWQSRAPIFRFDFEREIETAMPTVLDKLLALSYLAGTFTPGKPRA